MILSAHEDPTSRTKRHDRLRPSSRNFVSKRRSSRPLHARRKLTRHTSTPVELQALASQRAEASRAEQERLLAERTVLARELSVVDARKIDVDRRDAASKVRENDINRRGKSLSVTVAALQTGLAEIAASRINCNADIEKRLDLSPAADLLKKIGAVLQARTESVISDYARRREALLAKQRTAEIASAAAAEREKAAVETESKYKKRLEEFWPELKRLRRIRDVALVIVKHANHPALIRIGGSLMEAFDLLKAETSEKKEAGRGS